MKFSISMPDELVAKLDAEAKEIICTRSGAITVAVREWLANQEAKKLLPALQAALNSAAAGRSLSDEEKLRLDAFSALADMVTEKK